MLDYALSVSSAAAAAAALLPRILPDCSQSSKAHPYRGRTRGILAASLSSGNEHPKTV